MALPVSIRPIAKPVITEGPKITYRLNYLKGNLQQFTLIQFNKHLELDELVKLAKKYCSKNNMRFVFIEPAVTLVDIDDLEDVVE